MKKRMIWGLAAILVLSSVLTMACMGCGSGKEGNKEGNESGKNPTENAGATEAPDDSQSDITRIDWENLTWYEATLNTLGSTKAKASFTFPENFGGYQEEGFDQAYITFGSSADYGGPEGLYSITASYFRNGEGPSEEDIRAMGGTVYNQEINGKALLVNKTQSAAQDRYIYTYFASFDDDVNSRIVFIVTDAEEYGGFRIMFERKLWWG